ncbi:hypothetical protein N7474_001188, partial [Penicillium riverlandense]|uniref:uncharacterized protein n=1 Tax=Penicillium riverlandense TaxID=1903569 RepID=UPI0025492D68
MVGVPHSKGCALCRERHIKCDEVLPQCTQCLRYGRPCPGYRRTFRFQDEGPSLDKIYRPYPQRRDRRAAARAAAATSSTTQAESSSVQSAAHVPTPDGGAGVIAAAVRENAINLMRRHSASIPIDESVSPSLVRQSFKAAQPQLFLDFISAAFPTLYFHNKFRAGSDPGFPTYIILAFGQDSYLDSAICCLSSVYLAHLTQDRALLRVSRRMYAVSLGEVIRALAKPEHAMSDNMLCTAMMLSVYEMYAQTSPGAWVVHADAVKRLMQSRGTAAHEVGFGRSCWIAFRGFHIATAVYEGKPCFLDEEDWQRFAAVIMAEDAQKPGEWSAYADLCDLAFMEIAKCPRYLSEARNIISGITDPDPTVISSLISRIRRTSHRLQALSAQLRSCISGHGQRQQGIIKRPGSFIGPVPEIFPETGPSLLLRGAENLISTLGQLWTRLDDMVRVRPAEDLSPESPYSSVATPSGNSSITSPSLHCSTPSVTSKPFTATLPIRIHSELGQGPSRTSDRNDPRAVIWLDRVASSMGMLGTRVVVAGEGEQEHVAGHTDD